MSDDWNCVVGYTVLTEHSEGFYLLRGSLERHPFDIYLPAPPGNSDRHILPFFLDDQLRFLVMTSSELVVADEHGHARRRFDDNTLLADLYRYQNVYGLLPRRLDDRFVFEVMDRGYGKYFTVFTWNMRTGATGYCQLHYAQAFRDRIGGFVPVEVESVAGA